MLGTNDLKIEYSRTVAEIAVSIKRLVADVRNHSSNDNSEVPKIILINPLLIDGIAARFTEFYSGYYDNRSMQESMKLAAVIKAVAQGYDCLFLDTAGVAHSGEDGIHFSQDSSEPPAGLITNTVKEISNRRADNREARVKRPNCSYRVSRSK